MSRPAYDASDIADAPMMRPMKYKATRRPCHVTGCVVTGPHVSHRVIEIRQLALQRDDEWLRGGQAATTPNLYDCLGCLFETTDIEAAGRHEKEHGHSMKLSRRSRQAAP